MQTFIDESGSFSWANPGRSLFCCVTVSDAELPHMEKRFLQWKKSIIGNGKQELKGQELTPNQLYSFSHTVLPLVRRDIHLTLVGGDTSQTAETYIERLREQAAELFRLSSELCAKHNNRRLTETYRQMSGWVKSRSTSNLLWIIVLQQAIFDSLQHAIVRFADPEYDQEFEQIEITIDRSFIRRDEHLMFWREWLRNDLMKSSRNGTIMTIKQWPPDHPFRKKYRVHKGLYDYNDLFHKHTDFHDSKAVTGLQIADICANTGAFLPRPGAVCGSPTPAKSESAVSEPGQFQPGPVGEGRCAGQPNREVPSRTRPAESCRALPRCSQGRRKAAGEWDGTEATWQASSVHNDLRTATLRGCRGRVQAKLAGRRVAARTQNRPANCLLLG